MPHPIRRFAPAALLALAFAWLLACYSPGLRQDFFLIDDASLISLPQLRASYDTELAKTWFTPGAHLDFYPVRDLSYWVDIHLLGADASGADAFVFRMVNFSWVLACAALIWLVLQSFGVSPGFAALAAALWLLHPVHSELLMWPSARKDCMALAFGLASAYAFRKGRGIWAVVFFALSVFSKATFVLLPLAVPAVALATGDRSAFRRQGLAVWVPALALAAGVSLLQADVYSHLTDMRFFYSLDYRVRGVLAALGRMAAGWWVPSLNAVDVENWGNWVQLNSAFVLPGALVALLMLGWLGFGCVRRSGTWLWGAILFWLSYLPVSTVLFPHRNLYSVRYLEAPALILLIWGTVLLARRATLGKKHLALVSVLVALCAYGTWQESFAWEDGLTPFLKASRLEPENPSLLHFEYNELMDEQHWGHLPPERAALKEQLAQKLRTICGVGAGAEDLRNSHLCLNLWLDEFFGRATLDIRAPVERLALASIAQVNPLSAERLKRRIALRDRLEGRAGQEGNWLALAGNAIPGRLGAPSQRLSYWLYECLDGNRREAAALLGGWYRRHLIDTIDLGEFVSDTLNRTRVRRADLQGCTPR